MSSAKQDTSIGNQRLAVERYARDNGFQILRDYVDEDIAGWRADRDDFLKMIGDAANRDFRAVLCLDQDRFSRFKPSKFFRYLDMLADHDVRIVSVEQGELNVDDIAGAVLGVVNQHAKEQYSRDVSRKVTDGLIAKAMRGEWVAGRPPLGYE